MAAPTATVRGTPAGIKLKDGYQALITIGASATISFWEKTVQPPGMDGGDAIEQTTMHNIDWRTFASRSLITMTEAKGKAAYDPAVYTQLQAYINVETTITVQWADGTTIAFYGYLRMFEFSELVEGTQPEADFTIQPTNYDPVNHVEAAPVVVSVSGT